ncbi:MAG: YciI family protein [Candidatus Cybelea sp.]
MAEFLYLYRGGTRGATAEESEQIMQKWMNWFKELTASGNLKDGGQPLEAEGKVVRDKRGTVTDGPFAEAKDLVGGYTLIEAENLGRAAELARGCPILDRQGLVEVRPIMKMDM